MADNEHKFVNHGKYTTEKWEVFLKRAAERVRENDTQVDGKNNYKDVFLRFMTDYAEKNKGALDTAYNEYKYAISHKFFDEFYDLRDEHNLRRILSPCNVMVITANPIEKAMLHFCVMQKMKGTIIRIICGTNAYFVFKWGSYWVAHIHQPQTGSYKDLGLSTTVNEALKYFKPNVILSVGVAFGIDYETQNIGDVIVSKKLFPYSENKRDENYLKPDRSQDKIIDSWLDVRFVNANGFLDGVTYGGILSGGSVMSSFTEKDVVCAAYSKNDYIVGGEMEGSALFQISNSSGIPCAVIKGICDWGVAKNDIFPENPSREEQFKDSLQAFAMKNVVERCDPLFMDKTIFAASKTKELDLEKKKNLWLCLICAISNILIFGICILTWCNTNDMPHAILYSDLCTALVSIICIVLILIVSFKKKHDNKIITKYSLLSISKKE